MNINTLSKMPFSADAVWPLLDRVDRVIMRIFLAVVVPLSLLPPAMVYLAGSRHADALLPVGTLQAGGRLALVFFVCELLSVGLMGWLIKIVINSRHAHADVTSRQAFMLASIAPVPLWLSSLGLLVPSLAFNAMVSIAALALACGMTYQGVRSLCHVREPVEAAAVTQIVFGAGMLVWGILLLLLVVFPG